MHGTGCRCTQCRHFWWLPRPWTRNRAVQFRLSFGKYKGRFIGELAESGDGRDYLGWLVDHGRSNEAIAAAIMLGLREPETSVSRGRRS
jgi:uncharacterized protein (DUF3820 family)